MKVFYGCSTSDLLEHKKAYEKAREVILEAGHQITRDWLPESIRLAEGNIKDVPEREHYIAVLEAIITSDAIVLDSSVPSMSIGHQLTFALSKNKPTLLMADLSQGNVEDLFVSGYTSQLLSSKNYENLDQIKKILKEFLIKSSKKQKTRLNLVLDKIYNDYLDWCSFKYNQNKTDTIKKSLDKEMNSDEYYRKYLNSQK